MCFVNIKTFREKERKQESVVCIIAILTRSGRKKMEAPVPSGTTEAKIVVVTEDGDTNQKQPQSSSSAADGVSPSLHVREDREEVVARASRLAEELATQWQGGFTLSAPRVRPQPGAADPFTFYTAVLRRPRLVLAPMVQPPLFIHL